MFDFLFGDNEEPDQDDLGLGDLGLDDLAPEFGMTDQDLAKYVAKWHSGLGISHFNFGFIEHSVKRIKSDAENDFQDFETRPMAELWDEAREELADFANYLGTIRIRLARYLKARGIKGETELGTSAVAFAALDEMAILAAKAHHDLTRLESAISSFDADLEGIE